MYIDFTLYISLSKFFSYFNVSMCLRLKHYNYSGDKQISNILSECWKILVKIPAETYPTSIHIIAKISITRENDKGYGSIYTIPTVQ